MPPVSLLPEDALTSASELGKKLTEWIENDVDKFSHGDLNINGATPHIIAWEKEGKAHHYNLLKDSRDQKTKQTIAEGFSAESIALYSFLNDAQRAELAKANPTLARRLQRLPAVTDRDPLKQLRWEGYLNTAQTLERRVQELRDGEDWIDGILPKRSLIVTVGDSGEGKSPLIYQQAFCIAAGVPFLRRTTRQGRVLVVDYENGQGQVFLMLRQFAKYFKVPMPNDLYLLNANDVPPEWESAGHTLRDLIQDLKPSIVMIDSLGSAFPEIESKNDIANKKFKEFREVISSTGTSIQIATHTRKISDDPNRKPVKLEGGDLRRWFHQTRGARSIINGSDVRLAVEGHSKADLILRGFRRVEGELPALLLRRARDENGKALAYEQATGSVLLFNDDQMAAFDKLPKTFAFKEAKHAYGRGDQATREWLQKGKNVGILEQSKARGPYVKKVAGQAEYSTK